MPDERKDPEEEKGSACRIFIDAPNLSGGRGGSGLTNLSRIDWGKLMRILKDDRQDHNLKAIIYVILPEQYFFKESWPVYQKMKNAGFEVVCPTEGFRRNKDIDSLMICDILDDERVELNIYKDMTVVIVSGDGDFVNPLRSLKNKAKNKGVVLRIEVMSWRNQLSGHLEGVADKVIYLEKLFRFFDPEGYKEHLHSKKGR